MCLFLEWHQDCEGGAEYLLPFSHHTLVGSVPGWPQQPTFFTFTSTPTRAISWRVRPPELLSTSLLLLPKLLPPSTLLHHIPPTGSKRLSVADG